MTTPERPHVISGPAAAEHAGITYRQLDYWARRGWVVPSVEKGEGRSARRLYSPADVVRLAALGHFGRAGADVAGLGALIGDVTIPEGDFLVVAGPGPHLEAVPAAGLRGTITSGGPYLVFDPAELASALGLAGAGPQASRRSA